MEQLEASLGNWIEKQKMRIDMWMRGIRSRGEGGGSIWRTEKSQVAEGNRVSSLGSRRVGGISLVSLRTSFDLVLFSVEIVSEEFL